VRRTAFNIEASRFCFLQARSRRAIPNPQTGKLSQFSSPIAVDVATLARPIGPWPRRSPY
jgi:hypothetical protein